MGKENLRVLLAGNPNSGKSSLFNALTGLHQKISNIPGTTVERKTGRLSGLPEIEVIDLPGVYSIYPSSLDEYVALEPLIVENHPEKPDLIVQVIDAANLKRNLLLASQLSDLGYPMIWCVNMQDVAKSKGLTLDVALLESITGFPIIPINARKAEGLEALKSRILSDHFRGHFTFFEEAEKYMPQARKYFADWDHLQKSHQIKITSDEQINNETLLRYEKINQVLSGVEQRTTVAKLRTTQMDRWLVHPHWGPMVFAFFLLIIFQVIFSLASYPMDWIEMFFSFASNALSERLPDSWFSEMLADGLIPGIAGVVVFVPQIFLLFFFLGIMEDTGYMARVSFMMDRFVRRFGLSGKSVVPMVSGAACAIPAIMATRNIENWKDRLITMMVTPLISCSARLPVYILLIGLFVPDQSYFGLINLQGLMLMAMYLLGVFASLFSAIVFKWILRHVAGGYYIQELPVYHQPRWNDILLHAYQKCGNFISEAGKVIVLVSILLWFLASFGPPGHQKIKEVYKQTSNLEYKAELRSEMLEKSYAGYFGKAIEPVIEPLGFNWKIGIAIITSFAAREVFVGTMSTIYSVAEENSPQTLREKMLRERNRTSGAPVYNLAVALSLMIFYAFAMQCVSTLAVIKKETASLKWPLIQFVYMGLLAYAGSFITYRIVLFFL